MKDGQYSFRLPHQVVLLLDEAARHRGIPKAQLVREALVEFLNRPVGSAADRQAPGAHPGRTRSLGTESGRIMVAADFDAPLPEEIVREFEG